MTDKELLQQALDALNNYVEVVKSELNEHSWDTKIVDAGKPARDAIEAIKARLAQLEPEPVKPTLLCPTCGVDRLKQHCGGNRINCGIKFEAHTATPQPEPTVDGWPLYSGLPKPEQEPTAYLCENAVGHKYFRWKKPSSEYKPIALYTAHASPKRIWQGLTDGEVAQIRAEWEVRDYRLSELCRAIEAKLKEKNT